MNARTRSARPVLAVLERRRGALIVGGFGVRGCGAGAGQVPEGAAAAPVPPAPHPGGRAAEAAPAAPDSATGAGGRRGRRRNPSGAAWPSPPVGQQFDLATQARQFGAHLFVLHGELELAAAGGLDLPLNVLPELEDLVAGPVSPRRAGRAPGRRMRTNAAASGRRRFMSGLS